MKIGDEVCLRYSWSIVSTSPFTSSVTIDLLSEDMAKMGELKVPIYLDIFNIKPGSKFCRPSPFLPKEHPDYYQEFPQYAIWPENGLECEILLSPGFEENGLYSVVFTNSGKGAVSRKAQIIDYDFWSNLIKEYENNIFKGEEFKGIVTLIYYCSSKYEVEIIKKIGKVEMELPFNAENVRVIIQQENDNIVILPIKFLKNGPS